MPHPKNRLKLTGDTHLPDVDDDLLDADDEAYESPADTQSFTRRFDDRPGFDLASNATMRRPAPTTIPYRAIFLTLATVYVLGKLLRR